VPSQRHGAVPGKYKVSLSFAPTETAAAPSPDDPRLKGIPAIYFDPTTSPLEVEIKTSGSPELALTLDPKATTGGGANDPLLSAPFAPKP
jgi:hypothetical protein